MGVLWVWDQAFPAWAVGRQVCASIDVEVPLALRVWIRWGCGRFAGFFRGGLVVVKHVRERKHSRVSSRMDLVNLVS